MLTVVLSALLLLPGSPARESAKPSVYVVGDQDALEHLPSREAKDLQDSVADLRQQIGKRSNIVLASGPDEADIVLTVTERRIEFRHARTTDYGGGMKQSEYQSRYIIAYRLQAGGKGAEGEYYQDGSFVTWRRVAGGLAKEVEHWAETHREALLEGKSPE